MRVKMMIAGGFDTDNLTEEYDYRDLYIDPKMIQGFFVPEDDEVEEEIYNILYPTIGIVSVKAEKDIGDYLEKFI